MRKNCRIWTMFLAFCIVLHLGAVESLAAEREPYAYTITFYAGNQGIFPEDGSYQKFLSVIGSSGWRADRAADGKSITVSGVLQGTQVSYDAAADGAVVLSEGSRYYVMGVRRSGYDNTEVENTVVTVSRDLDHVVGYGIRGDMTTYRVNYVDEDGNVLADYRIYTGKVGDRPVAAYQYIEGWQPQAYNLTKVLVKNETENVFDFVYTRVQTGGGGGGAAGTPNAGAVTGEGAGGAVGAGTAAGAGGAVGAGTAAGGGAAAAAGENGEPEEGNVPTVVPDEEVPAEEGPRDLINLDDEEVPLSGQEPENPGTLTGNMLMSVTIGAAAASALAVLLILWIGNRRREDSGEEE